MSLRFLTAGESHGQALMGILEGMPSGLTITAEEIHLQLRRRKLGYGRGARQKMEDDAVELLSGVRHGETLGSPIGLLIRNRDWQNWSEVMQAEPFSGEVRRKLEVPRPGHADYVGGLKYAHSDMRNVLERASARETTMRVALATVARKFLQELGVTIASRVTAIGTARDTTTPDFSVTSLNEKVDSSPVRCLDAAAESRMIAEVDAAQKKGDTLGGVFEVVAEGVPLGLGSYSQWDRRLDGKIAEAFLSLNAIKGFEIGMGFELAQTPGSQAHDEFAPAKVRGRVTYRTNRSGGIDGGMSSGEPLVVRAAMKPLATLMNALPSVKLATGNAEPAHVERSDVCAVPSAAVIGESLLALTLTEVILEKFGGDSLNEIRERVNSWRNHTASC
jgi:chorismate synthase